MIEVSLILDPHSHSQVSINTESTRVVYKPLIQHFGIFYRIKKGLTIIKDGRKKALSVYEL
jgi:hypothetical protein